MLKRTFLLTNLILLFFSCNLLDDRPSIEIANKGANYQYLPGLDITLSISSSSLIDDESKIVWFINGNEVGRGSAYLFKSPTPGEHEIIVKASSDSSFLSKSKSTKDSVIIKVTDKYSCFESNGLPSPMEFGWFYYMDKIYSKGDRIAIYLDPLTVYFSEDQGQNFKKISIPEEVDEIIVIPNGDNLFYTVPKNKNSSSDYIKVYNSSSNTYLNYINMSQLGASYSFMSDSIAVDQSIYVSFYLSSIDKYRVHYFDLTSPLDTTNYWEVGSTGNRGRLYYNNGLLHSIGDASITYNSDYTVTISDKIGQYLINDTLSILYNNGEYPVVKLDNKVIKRGTAWEVVSNFETDAYVRFTTPSYIGFYKDHHSLKIVNTTNNSLATVTTSYSEPINGSLTSGSSLMPYETGEYIIFEGMTSIKVLRFKE